MTRGLCLLVHREQLELLVWMWLEYDAVIMCSVCEIKLFRSARPSRPLFPAIQPRDERIPPTPRRRPFLDSYEIQRPCRDLQDNNRPAFTSFFKSIRLLVQQILILHNVLTRSQNIISLTREAYFDENQTKVTTASSIKESSTLIKGTW